MKKILFLLLLISNIISGQGLILKIDTLRQKNPQLCWAACTEMVDKFNGDTATQCNLGAIKYNLKRHSRAFDCYIDSMDISVKIFSGSSFSREFSSILQRGTNLYAKEDSINLTFEFVKKQLSNCKPFILNLSMPYHALTVKGYITSTDSTRWLIVNDPNFSGAKQKYMYFDSLNIKSITHYRYSSLIYDIHLKTDDLCSSNCLDKEICSLPTLSLISVDLKEKISSNLTNLPLFEILSYEKLQKLNNNIIPSYKAFLEKRFDLKYLNYDNDTYEIQQYSGNKWTIVLFYKNTFPQSISVNIQSTQQNISFIPSNILRYPLFHLEFYKLTNNNKTYFVPVANYPSLELKTNIAYPEGVLLNTLKKLKIS